MPNVGRKKFPYTARGRADAKRYARRTGQPMNESSRGGPGPGYGPGSRPRSRPGYASASRGPGGLGYGSGSPRRRPRPSGASRFAPPGRRSSLLGSNRRSRRRNASPLSRMLSKKRYA